MAVANRESHNHFKHGGFVLFSLMQRGCMYMGRVCCIGVVCVCVCVTVPLFKFPAPDLSAPGREPRPTGNPIALKLAPENQPEQGHQRGQTPSSAHGGEEGD